MTIKNPWIFGAIGLFLTFLITGHSLYQQRQLVIDAAEDELTAVLTELRVEWSQTTAELEQTLNGFQNYLELTEQMSEPDPSSLRRTMDSLVLGNHYIVSLVVADFTGQVLHWTNSGPKPNLSERDYFKVHTSNLIDGVTISAPLPSLMSPGQFVFGASKATRHPDGTLDKVLIAIIDTSRLFRLLENVRSSQHQILTVLSSRADIYARMPDDDGKVGSRQPDLLKTQQADNIKDNSSAIVTVDGRKHLVMIHHLDCCQLHIRGEIPLVVALESWKKSALIIVAAGTAIALILLWQLIRLLHFYKREQQLADQLHQASRQDPLTGLPLFPTDRNHEIDDSDSLPAMALITIGPDRFSDFLQHFGEQAADDLLVHCARSLEKLAPPHAHLYRASGSSFCLSFPETDREQVLIMAEKIRKNLAAEPFNHTDNEATLAISAGVTIWNGRNAEISAAVQRAGDALSMARKNGGDQVYWLAERESWLERKQS
ncbi:MAG: diguanylate cyclase [Pelovirga sp.]